MRFELVPKAKVTLTAVTILSHKLGQNEVKPAADLMFSGDMANAEFLPKLHKSLLSFYFDKGGKPASQGALDGVPPVSNVPSLTEPAMRLGRQSWDDEQTGSKLTIHQAVSKIVLRDCTVRKLDWENKEGGGVKYRFHVYTADVDEETLGALAVLKSHELDIELEAPEAHAQKEVTDPETPEEAFIKGSKKK